MLRGSGEITGGNSTGAALVHAILHRVGAFAGLRDQAAGIAEIIDRADPAFRHRQVDDAIAVLAGEAAEAARLPGIGAVDRGAADRRAVARDRRARAHGDAAAAALRRAAGEADGSAPRAVGPHLGGALGGALLRRDHTSEHRFLYPAHHPAARPPGPLGGPIAATA